MLYLHNCELIDRDELDAIPTPPATKRHRPVPHARLADAISAAATDRGIGIKEEQWAISHQGMRLFGSVDLGLPAVHQLPAGLNAAIAIRHANDRSMALEVVAGARVIVCGNGLLIGDIRAVKRRHTAGLRLDQLIGDAIDEYLEVIAQLSDMVAQLRACRLTDLRAKALLHDLFLEQRVMAAKYLPLVSERYFHSPEHREQFGGERNRWGLLNAVTEVAKQLSAPLQLHSHRKLTQAMLPSLN